ncbi:MAG: alpha/beta fold hydrolase [Bacteriovoracaceae bacterium]
MIFAFILFSFLIESAYTLTEDHFEADYEELVIPLQKKHFNLRSFQSFDKTRISYFAPKLKRSQKALIILTGRTEPAVSYFEHIHDLLPLGHDIYILDHRGQGFSDRPHLKKEFKNKYNHPEYQKGHIKSFSHYTKDFEFFLKKNLKSYKTIDVMAHSMGAAVTLDLLLSTNIKINKIVLTVPMLKIPLPGPYSFTKTLLHFLNSIGFSESYIPGEGLKNPKPEFEKNRVSSSKTRWTMDRKIDNEFRETSLGGVTFGWVNEAVKVSEKIFNNRDSFNRSILLFDVDTELISDNSRTESFCRANSKCQYIKLKDAKHEVLIERDEIRNLMFQKIYDYFEAGPFTPGSRHSLSR